MRRVPNHVPDRDTAYSSQPEKAQQIAFSED
jgi:hypothetical protein